jgi:O-acetyl-ADP-ribose deacetylase (regulator of RNase III)
MPEIKYVIGDATRPTGGLETKVIVHCCNNIGVWGKGFVTAISKRWPHVRDAYLSLENEYGTINIGLVQYVEAETFIVVANLIGQIGIASRDNPSPVWYPAIKYGLQEIANDLVPKFKWHAQKSDPIPSVHMPRIGCGLAGGSWDKIEPIINDTLIKSGINVTVYDLPDSNFQ